jgi:hypothetical protein
MHVPPLLHAVLLIHDFADREAVVWQSRPLGGRSRHCPCFRTVTPATCCTLFLLNVFSLASLCDAEGEKHPASQDTCGASLASPHIRLPTVRPSTAQWLLRGQDTSLRQAILIAAS